MAIVICDMSVSLDGYVTGPNDSRENPFGDGAHMLHDWLSDTATDADRGLLRDYVDGTGAIVMGRRSFEKNEGDGGWGDAGPLGQTPCFVVTHNPPERQHPPPMYTFVTDGVAAAIAQAKAVAGGRAARRDGHAAGPATRTGGRVSPARGPGPAWRRDAVVRTACRSGQPTSH